MGQVRRDDRAGRPRGLQAPVGDELPRRSRDRDPGLRLLQRRRRQDHHLRHGGAAADQDRGLRGPEEGRPVEDRREAEREEHHDPARFVHRSRAHPPRHRRRPRALRGRGLPVRRDQAGDEASRRRPEARARDLPRDGGAEGQDRRDRLCREQGADRREAQQEDEGEQAKGLLRLHHRWRHLQGRQVRRGRAADHRLLSRRRVHHGPGRPAADEDPRRLEGRQDALDPAAGADHRRQEVRGRRLRVRRQQGRQLRGAAPALQDRDGRNLQPEEGEEGSGEGAGGLRLGRLFRVHRLSRPAAARCAQGRRGRRRRRGAAVARSAVAHAGRRVGRAANGEGRYAARRRDDARG